MLGFQAIGTNFPTATAAAPAPAPAVAYSEATVNAVPAQGYQFNQQIK